MDPPSGGASRTPGQAASAIQQSMNAPRQPIVEEPIAPIVLEEVHFVSSLDDWLRQQRSRSDHLQQVQLGQLRGRRCR
ncbi:unnamed protein product [Urochloa humidicola]